MSGQQKASNVVDHTVIVRMTDPPCSGDSFFLINQQRIKDHLHGKEPANQ